MLKKYWIHILLFLVTIVTTTLAGAEWMFGKFIIFPGRFGMTFDDFLGGFSFSIPFLLILTVHEFGHYLTARYYQIKVTLPYYIPLWVGFLAVPTIGTMGAFIKILGKPRTTRQFFDIGVAGPLSGFVVAIFVLLYGFYTLPPKEYIFEIHPEYQIFGEDYENIVYDLDTVIYVGDIEYLSNEVKEQIGDSAYFATGGLELGSNLLFDFFKDKVAPDPELVPNMKELYHYPWLFAGYLALFFTALNLLPIGQLDGGHVLYGLLGYKRANFAFKVFFVAFILFAGYGMITPHLPMEELLIYGGIYMLYLNIVFRTVAPDFRIRILISIWIFIIQYVGSSFLESSLNSYEYLVFAFVVGRFLGTDHPPSEIENKLDLKRKILGWIAVAIFIVSFSPSPFNMDIGTMDEATTQEEVPPGKMANIISEPINNHYMEGGND